MGTPKALLPYRGGTFLDTLVDLFGERCSTVIVVLGAGAEELLRQRVKGDLRGPGGRPHFIVNPDFGRGQLSSMQCGLRAVSSEADGVLFTLVDHPAVSESSVEALLGAAGRRPLVCVPRYQGRRGHPIWFSRALIPEFLAEPVGGAARDVVRRHEAETEFVDLDDPGIVADIDDPAAYRSLVGDAS
jgi:molybdenum cofactor cytidylyltransferase